MRPERARAYAFGPFQLEPAERQLRRDGRLIALTPKAFDTLHALAAAGGRALSKEDLVKAVWPDTNVSDATLSQNIFALRKGARRVRPHRDGAEVRLPTDDRRA